MLCEQGSWGHVCLYANQENITEHHQWGKVITANAVHRDCSWQLRASRLWWSKLEEREKQQLQQTAWSRGSPWQSVNKVEPQTMSFDMMKSRTRATAGEGAKKTGKARKGSFNVLHLILIIDGTTQVLTYWEAPCSCKKKKRWVFLPSGSLSLDSLTLKSKRKPQKKLGLPEILTQAVASFTRSCTAKSWV